MRINGTWKMHEDGVARPVIYGEMLSSEGIWEGVEFLVDTGADRTVLSAAVLAKLGLATLEAEEDISGLGGTTGSVLVEAKLNLQRDDGNPVLFTSQFTAVTDAAGLEFNVLGRDIMDLFAVIIDRPGKVVCLLSQKHRYTILPAP